MTESLKAQTVKNVSYNAIGRGIAFGFQGISNIILSRELGASDYGVVGFALIFINFLRSFGDLGINSAVVQDKDLQKEGLYTAYTIKLFLGFIIFIVAYILAGFAPLFFDDKDVVNIIRILSLNFIISSFAFVPNVLLTKDLNYKNKSIAETALIATNSIFSIIFVYSGFKYWSMVFGNVLSVVIYVILLNAYKPVPLRFALNKSLALTYLRYGTNLFFSGITMFMLWNLDNFIIGSVNGSTALGYYSVAFNWGSMIATVLVSILFNVMFPTLSKISDQSESLKQAFLQMFKYTLLFAVLVNMTLFCVADDYLKFILGKGTDKWLPASMPLQVLCFYGILRSLSEMISCLLMATGRTAVLFKATLFIAVLEVLFIYPVLIYLGIVGISVLVTVIYGLQLVYYYYYINSNLNCHYIDIMPTIKQVAVVIVSFIVIRIGFARLDQSFFIFLIKIITYLSVFFLIDGLMTSWKMLKIIKIKCFGYIAA